MKTLLACTLAVAITCSLSAAETEKYIEKDFPSYMTEAVKTNKLLFISIGREACSNCVKFYDYIKDGSLKLDEKKFIYLKLDIDNQEHVDYFSSYFTVMGNVLPFVGVMNGSGATFGASRTGYGTAEDYQEFLKKALEDEKDWNEKQAKRAEEEAQLKAAQEARKAQGKK
jgi:chloramphenicol O-acetyltransferase